MIGSLMDIMEKNLRKISRKISLSGIFKDQIERFERGKIEIERFSDKINIIIYSARPGLIIGRGGEGVEKLRTEVLKELFKKNKLTLKELRDLSKKIKIEIRDVPNPWTSADLVSQWIAQR